MNPYVIPGLEEKRSYIEQCNAHKIIKRPVTSEEVFRDIYLVCCDYFDVNPKTPLSLRKKEIIAVRHWTIFVAKCKGFSNSEATAHFQITTSMAQFIIKKIMAEIEIYDKSRDAFDFFIITHSLIKDLKNVNNRILKNWLREYYPKMQKAMQLLAYGTSKPCDEQHNADIRNLMDKIHNHRVNIYSQYTSTVNTANKNSKTPW